MKTQDSLTRAALGTCGCGNPTSYQHNTKLLMIPPENPPTCDAMMNKPIFQTPATLLGCLQIFALLLLFGFPAAAAESRQALSSTWPQAYSVQRDPTAGLLTLSTLYY